MRSERRFKRLAVGRCPKRQFLGKQTVGMHALKIEIRTALFISETTQIKND